MKKFPIALQLYSVRNEMMDDFAGTLKAVKNLGYEGVEFAGLFGKSAAEVKELCAEIGLVPISAHVPLKDMLNNPDLLSTYAEIGCRYVAIPYLEEMDRPGHPGFLNLIENAKILGKKAASLGMALCYHNHDFEFVKIDGTYALDVLYNEVPQEYLETELDTCWVNVGGENPVDYIRKYTGRCHILHLKDFVGGKSANMYGLIGKEEEEKEETAGQFAFRPLGQGRQDFPTILQAAEKAGTQWVVVEQDEPNPGNTPMECAKISIDYLHSL